MKNEKHKVEFQMRLTSISVLKFAQYDIEFFDTKKEDAIEYQSEFNLKVLEESSSILIETTLKLKVLELEKYFGELKVATTFHISPFEKIIKQDNDSHQIPDLLVANLFSIVTGIVRGILFEKLRGTVLQDEILPLIDINKLVGVNKNRG
jgi:hypothetical protein